MENEIPELPKPKRRKGPVNPKGRPKVSKEERKKNETLKKVKRKEYIQDLVREGKLSSREAREHAAKAGITLDGDIDPEEVRSDPKAAEELSKQYEIKKSLIEIRGGRGHSLLNADEKIKFFEYLKTGMGRSAACLELHIDYRRFRNSYEHDDDFRMEVLTIEESLVGYCLMHVYNAAQNGDVASSEKYIRIRHNIKQSHFAQKIAQSEHLLKKKAVETQIGAMTGNARPSFMCFSNEELDEYTFLTTSVSRNKPLTNEQMSRLGELSAKLIRANTPRQPNTDYVAEVANDATRLQPIETTFSEET